MWVDFSVCLKFISYVHGPSLQSHENADEAFMILKKENLALEEGQSQEMGEKFAVPAMLKSPSRQFSKQYSRQYSGESGGAVQVATKTKTDKQKVVLASRKVVVEIAVPRITPS